MQTNKTSYQISIKANWDGLKFLAVANGFTIADTPFMLEFQKLKLAFFMMLIKVIHTPPHRRT